MTVHQIPAGRAEHCPRCGAPFADMPPTDALTEDPDLATCVVDDEPNAQEKP